MNARHSKATVKRGTPEEYVSLARIVLGIPLGARIDLDPMTSSAFNETVKAERIYTEKDDCFKHEWSARTMFINPAGGMVRKAWKKTVTGFMAGHIFKAIWVGFSVEQLNVLADEKPHPLDFSSVLLRKRISFIRHDGFEGSPGHANYVIGMGVPHDLFTSVFGNRGRVDRGVLAVDSPRISVYGLDLNK